MDIIDELFEFELKNELFDIVDKRGTRPWEAVRYYVFNRIITNRKPQTPHSCPKKDNGAQLFQKVRNKLHFILYLAKHRNCPFMFLLASRDKRDGCFYDKISDSFFEQIDKEKTFAIESCVYETNYCYNSLTCDMSFFCMFERFTRADYDFSFLHKLIMDHFPDVSIDISELNKWYRAFLSQYYYFRWLFKLTGTKKLFMVQNGILKGVFAAAQSLGVEVLEFQHGQISYNHPAYSYPSEKYLNASKLHHPSKLLLFGDYWAKNRVYPGVINIVIGNDFYSNKAIWCDVDCKKKILVVSNKIEGRRLMKYVKSILEQDSSFYFFFKLHPNQYNELHYYLKEFEVFKNVEVISDSKTTNVLLSKSEAILVVQSTVELEALRDGKKIFVVKEDDFEAMDFVFSEPGVYLVESSNSFLEQYAMHADVQLKPRDDIFQSFNREVAKSLLTPYN